MRAMKDSGVEWLGEVPAGWGLHRAKRLFKLTNHRGNDDLTLLAATQKYGMWPQDRLEGVVRVKDDTDLGKFRTVHKNDFVISLRSFQGGFERSDFEGVCSPAYQTFCATRDIDHQYFKYLFKSPSFIDHMNSLTLGIREGKTIKFDDFATQLLPVPPLDEQRRIADFLDEKCAQIDRAITSAEQSIQEYKAYRKGLIDEVSIHGLSPASEKKKIGIPYVDWVPAHWTKAKFRFLLTEFVDCPHETPLYSPTGEYCVIRAGDQTAGGLAQGKMLRLEKDEYERRTRRLKLKRGDIVYGREGSWGKASFVPEDDRYCLGQRMMQFRCNDGLLHPLFAAYVLNASYVYEQGRKDEVGSTSHHVNISTIASYRIALPPLDEQRRIADFLDEKCAQIDRAVEAKQAIIDELKAYKKSLIYEVVTGKREV